MQMKTLPPSAIELVQELDAMFPARCIGASETLAEAQRYAGKRELVDFLKTVLKRTEDARPTAAGGSRV